MSEGREKGRARLYMASGLRLVFAVWLFVLVVGNLVIRDASAESAPPGLGANCTWPADIDKHLASVGQKHITTLVSQRGWVLRVYASEIDGRWTVVRVMPDGCGYGVDAGRQWFRPSGARGDVH